MSEKRIEKSGKLLSVWALFIRCSFCKIMAVLFLMALAECVSFYVVFQRYALPDSPEVIIDGSQTAVIFLTALGLIFFILSRAGEQLDGKSQYTLMRLRLSGRQLFLFGLIYHVLCMAVLFAVQTVLAFWMVRLYEKTFVPAYTLERLLFLTFYRNEFLHCLLPMAETGKWVRNILLVLAFGTETCVRGKNHGVTRISLFIMTACWFVSPIGTNYRDIICSLVYCVVIGADILQADLFRTADRQTGLRR